MGFEQKPKMQQKNLTHEEKTSGVDNGEQLARETLCQITLCLCTTPCQPRWLHWLRSLLGERFSVKANQASPSSMSLEKRVRMRPKGVVSKNRIGLRRSLWNSLSWRAEAAFMVHCQRRWEVMFEHETWHVNKQLEQADGSSHRLGGKSLSDRVAQSSGSHMLPTPALHMLCMCEELVGCFPSAVKSQFIMSFWEAYIKVATQFAKDISPIGQKLHVAAKNKLILLMEYLTLTKISSQLEVKKDHPSLKN